ncbi:hypothetical protein QTP88_010124 [Uroleucon formosanum]
MAKQTSRDKQTPRDFLREFIELYQSFPCLWLVKSKEYSDRKKKNLAYEEMVKKYKEFDPSADRNTVVKKNNALRTVYKKELSKVNNSSKSVAGADEIYKPSLWYFDLLHFLNDQDSLSLTRNTMDDEDEETKQYIIQIEEETDIHNIPVTEIDVNTPSTSSSLPPPSLLIPTPPFSKKRKNPDHRLDKAFGLLTAAASATYSDEQQHFGNFVANKLKKYSARTQSAIQHAFMGIFLNANNGMYEQPLPYTFDYPSRSTISNMSQVSNLSSTYSTPNPTPPEPLQVHLPQVDDEDILNFFILH